jgi:hypothetical protein
MKRGLKFVIVICIVAAVVATASHLLVRCLSIRTGGVGYKLLGDAGGKPLAFAEGSSLMCDGLAWERISQEVGCGIENWFVAGSSPSEWERLLNRAGEARLTFIAVSAYDLNEYFLCDYRADVVPLTQTVKDLWQSDADWPFSKRILGQYPLRYLRVLFPTLGRSDGVMVGIREKLSSLLRPWVKMDSESRPAVATGQNVTREEIKTEKLTDWSQSRLLRRLTLMRSACQGKSAFDGPKKLALLRMLAQAQRQGRVVVIVLPVSPLYASEFLKADGNRRFEETLSEIERANPKASWIHVEQLSTLDSNDYFWDLVHMNAAGQQIATDAFLSQLRVRLSSK